MCNKRLTSCGYKECILLLVPGGYVILSKKRKRKDSAGSDNTASMIKGGGYLGARTRQPPTAQTIKKELMWVSGGVCRSSQTQTLTVVACVILQCIPCFYECRCMSDGVLIHFVCKAFNLMAIQIKVCQRFISIVFVDSPHNSNKDHVELDFPISLSD
jgi:hypothetical protein